MGLKGERLSGENIPGWGGANAPVCHFLNKLCEHIEVATRQIWGEKNLTKHVTYPKIQTQAVSQILHNADWKCVDTWKDHLWPEAPVKNKENAVLRRCATL